ncbi:MAG: DUF1634 domain-containing protein [Phycisphaeraceae bacterium]|nr:DUF1634 domain-containing protein [Phycisphaeraceae bacterium]
MNTSTPPAPAAPLTADERVRRMELMLFYLLRIGLTLSFALLVFGTVLTLVHHPDYLNSTQALAQLTEPGADFPHTVTDVWNGLWAGQGRSFSIAGLLLLILTPVLRVVVSAGTFVRNRDWFFALITTLVFLVLLTSFWLGMAK